MLKMTKQQIEANLKIGIEFEGVYNEHIDDIKSFLDSGETEENGVELEGFSIHGDGSIHYKGEELPTGFKPIEREVILEAVKGRDAFFNQVEVFISFFSLNGVRELRDSIIFNKTTGMHIHFSLPNNNGFFKSKLIKPFIKTREYFFERLDGATTLTNEEKEGIKKQYNRKYAKPLKLAYNGNYATSGERYAEWNEESEKCGKGIEWRSPNLLNIQRWEQLRELLTIYYDCCVQFCLFCQEKERTGLRMSGKSMTKGTGIPFKFFFKSIEVIT